MKRLTMGFVGVLALGVMAGNAVAANSIVAGAKALSVGLVGADNRIIKGRLFDQNDFALVGGVMFTINGGDADGTDIGILGGARKYLKRADFAPFFGGFVSYASTNDSTIKEIAILGEFGAEYFFHKSFSVEGVARAGFTSTDIGLTTSNAFGTQGAGLSVNYYF